MEEKFGHLLQVRRVLDIALRYRPHLRKTWKLIYNIPVVGEALQAFIELDGVHKLIGSVILLSLHEKENVTLMEQLFWAYLNGLLHDAQEFSNLLEGCHHLIGDRRLLSSSLVQFTKENPSVIFAGFLPPILRALLYTHEDLHAVLPLVGKNLLHHGRPNVESVGYKGKKTSLMWFIWNQQEPDLVKQLIMSVDEKEKLVNAQDEAGFTAAHFCVIYRNKEVLRILNEFSADFSIKDFHGRTPKEMAEKRGYCSFVEAFDEFSPSHSGLNIQLQAHLQNSSIAQEIHVPSASVVVSGQEESSNSIVRYVKMVAPQLLKLDASFLIIPPTMPDHCPSTEEERTKGWEAEKLVFESMKSAGSLLMRENAKLNIAFFHGISYPFQGQQPAAKQKVHNSVGNMATACVNMESEVDGMLLMQDIETGEGGAIIMETKGGTSLRGVLRQKALHQLKKHLENLQTILKTPLDWVQLCLVLPNYPQYDADEEGIRLEMKQKIETASDRLNIPVVGLCRQTLVDAKKLVEWLKNMTKPGIPMADYAKLLEFGLVRTMGILVPAVSRELDDKFALLTSQQRESLVSCCETKFIVTTGHFGTGKSLIAEAQIMQLLKSKLVNKDNLLAYVSPIQCAIADDLMKRRLQPFHDFIIFITTMSGKECSQVIDTLKNGFYGKVKFAIFDNFEYNGKAMFPELYESLARLSEQIHFVHVFQNSLSLRLVSFDVDRAVKRVGGKIFHLSTRIRNSTALSNFLELVNTSSRTSQGMIDIAGDKWPDPCGVNGPPVRIVEVKSTPARTRNESVDLEGFFVMASKVVHHLIKIENIEAKTIAIVMCYDSEPGNETEKRFGEMVSALDRRLVEDFPFVDKQHKKTMAPTLIHRTLADSSSWDIIYADQDPAHSMIEAALKESGDAKKFTENIFSFDEYKKSIIGATSIPEETVRGILLRLLTLRHVGRTTPDYEEKVLLELRDALNRGSGSEIKRLLEQLKELVIPWKIEENTAICLMKDLNCLKATANLPIEKLKEWVNFLMSLMKLITIQDMWDSVKDFSLHACGGGMVQSVEIASDEKEKKVTEEVLKNLHMLTSSIVQRILQLEACAKLDMFLFTWEEWPNVTIYKERIFFGVEEDFDPDDLQQREQFHHPDAQQTRAYSVSQTRAALPKELPITRQHLRDFIFHLRKITSFKDSEKLNEVLSELESRLNVIKETMKRWTNEDCVVSVQAIPVLEGHEENIIVGMSMTGDPEYHLGWLPSRAKVMLVLIMSDADANHLKCDANYASLPFYENFSPN